MGVFKSCVHLIISIITFISPLPRKHTQVVYCLSRGAETSTYLQWHKGADRSTGGSSPSPGLNVTRETPQELKMTPANMR